MKTRILSLLCAAALVLTACTGGSGASGTDGVSGTEDGQSAGSSELQAAQPDGSSDAQSPPDGQSAPDGQTTPDAPPEGERPDDMPAPHPDGGGPGGFGGSGTVNQGTAAHTLDAASMDANDSYTSDGDDENALRVDGVSAILEKVTVDKSGGDSSNTEDGDFYGLNAAVLATNGARFTLRNSAVRSSALNGNGVFCYGTGTEVTLENVEIVTTGDHSGGIQTTGGGATEAFDLTIHTSGSSSAAIRTDRGGGQVSVDGGAYETDGLNSPAVYSTADITVQNAALSAANSEALVVEGKNAITLVNCAVSGSMSDRGSSADINIHNVMLYQSMSGDAESGTSRLSIQGGSLSCGRGDQFFVTNTRAEIELDGVALTSADGGRLLVATGNDASRGWGTAGANGAQVALTARNQTLEGDVVVDTVSTLSLNLADNSTFTGTVNIVDNAEGGAAVENNALVTVGGGCTWVLTGDCLVTDVTVESGGNIEFNGHNIALTSGAMYYMTRTEAR